MIAIPAIDLRDGCCVQLVGGSYDAERVRIADPLSVATRWRDAGFRRLHVVDLDAAMGCGSNGDLVAALAATPGMATQAGGGLRTEESIRGLLESGVARAVVGTRALLDREWLSSIANEWPGRVVVAADARNGIAVVRGWTMSTERSVIEIAEDLADCPLAGLLVTAVDREGQMAGPDLELVRKIAAVTDHVVIASGGIGTMEHLCALAAAGADEAVIGMALYTGALDPARVAQEFAA